MGTILFVAIVILILKCFKVKPSKKSSSREEWTGLPWQGGVPKKRDCDLD